MSSDELEDIAEIIEKYPEFKPMYDTVFDLCKNIEGVMDMFSEELYILDRNTEKLMIDEYSRIAEELKQEIRTYEEQMKVQEEQMKVQEEQMKAKEEQIREQENIITEKDKIIESLYKQLNNKN